MKLKQLLHTLLLPVLFFSVFHQVYAQDPAQYGKPFGAVPDTRDINIYQVNIRAYSAGSNLAGVTARLDKIKDLGNNVVYLMPVFPAGTDARSANSPYCIKDFTSVGAEYGTLADLRTLVNGAHSRGMAVILDWIVNQTSWDHPWIKQHPDWYIRDANGVIQQLGTYTDVAALDVNNAEMRAAMINAMRYWVFAANVDGFRCDFADNPPVSFWKQTIDNLRSIKSHKLIMLAEGKRPENFTAGFDLNFGFNFYYDALRAIHSGASAGKIQTVTDIEYSKANATQMVARYTGNHDTNGSEGTPLEVFGGTAGVMANFVVAAYMKGAPFLYGSQEVAFDKRIPFPWDGVKIDWTQNPGVTAEFKKVIGFRNSSTAIRRGTMLNYSDPNVCAFTKISGTEKVLVFSNLRSTKSDYIMPAALAGKYKDAYTGATVNLTSGSALSLNGFQYRTLTAKNNPTTAHISVSPLNSSIAVGTTQQITATVNPSDTGKPVVWSSSDTNIATVNNAGLVTAITLGTVTITAALDSKNKATSAVTVIPPHTFTVHFFKPSNWGTGINIYWYNADPAGSLPSPSWPGVSMTNEGDGWYSYTFTNITSATVIFNDGTRQSADVNRGTTGWYINGAWYDTKPQTSTNTFTVSFYRPSDWGTGINIYWYNAQPATSPASPSWPGAAMTDNGDGWYSYTFSNMDSATVIFNDGTKQSADVTRGKTGWYVNGAWYDTKPNTFTINFFRPSDWGTGINVYWYNAQPEGSLPSPSWPGIAMTNNGDGWYSYTFIGISSAILIFNDGTNQTADGIRDKTGWYLNGVWYDTKPVTSSPNSFTVNFFRPSDWGTGINVYWYNAQPSGALPSPAWPGVAMTNNGDGWYSYTFNGISSAILIFNDGTNKTPDGIRDKTGWYLNGVWYDTKPSTLAARSAVKPADSEVSLMKMFPNPAKGNSFNIYIPGLHTNELATLSILDVNGKTALKTQVHQSARIENHLKPGLYFVKISANGINITKKLVVQ